MLGFVGSGDILSGLVFFCLSWFSKSSLMRKDVLHNGVEEIWNKCTVSTKRRDPLRGVEGKFWDPHLGGGRCAVGEEGKCLLRVRMRWKEEREAPRMWRSEEKITLPRVGGLKLGELQSGQRLGGETNHRQGLDASVPHTLSLSQS